MITKHCDKAAPKYFAIKYTPSLASIFHGKGKTVHLKTKLLSYETLNCRWEFWSEHEHLNTVSKIQFPEQNNKQSSFCYKIKIYHLSHSHIMLSKLLILAECSMYVTYELNFSLACFTTRRKCQIFKMRIMNL